jgi:tetratricopeptide (TPR) repeat protein
MAATFIWALHPMRSEAVVWIASRKEELWALLALTASTVWIGFVGKGGRLRYWTTFALFAFSCFSKPTAVIFPALAFLLQKLVRPEMKTPVRKYLPFLAFSAVVGIMAIYSQSNPSGAERIDLSDTEPSWRLLNAFVSLGLYVFNTFLPVSIHMDYRAVFGGMPLRAATGAATLAALAAAIAAFAFFSRDREMKRSVFAACVWYLIAVLPVLGMLGVTGDKAFADRYSYMPSVMLSFVAALAIVKTRARLPRLCGLAVCAASAFVLAMAARPVIASFENDLTAYSRVLESDPGHWRALRMVGRIYAAQDGRTDEGIDMLKRSLSLRPSRITVETLAYLLAHRGKGDDFAEVRRLGAAVVRDPALDGSGMILDALGVVSMREGDDRKAVEFFCASLRAPGRSYTNVYTILNLGLSLANSGKRFEAVETLAKLHAAGESPARDRARKALEALRKGSRTRFEWQP